MNDPDFAITYFNHASARFKTEEQTNKQTLAERIRSEHAEHKENLNWLKLARFGENRSKKQSLRHDKNVIAITGIEADYDGEEMSFGQACNILRHHNIDSIVYTSPSHTIDKPRWRVLCVLHTHYPPSYRAKFVARLNGVFGGIFSEESFTISQSYYYGYIGNGAAPQHHQVEMIDGEFIDVMDELDANAIGRLRKKTNGAGYDGERPDFGELVRAFTSGETFHMTLAPIIGGLATDMPRYACLKVMRGLFDLATEARPDLATRWKEVIEVADYVYSKEAEKAPQQTKSNGAAPSAIAPESLAQIKGLTFMPLNWITPTWIPEGVTLFSGKPKLGKSWLMLATAIAVGRGEVVLDQMCAKRDVLYCALEDTKRRMQARTNVLLGSEPDWPDNVKILLELPTVDQGGIERLQQLIDDWPSVGVIIIDTLARFRGGKRKDEDNYSADYRTMAALGTLSNKTGVAFIVVHHVRKQSADDLFDTISGTMGLSGAADTLLMLTRAGDALRLSVRGRDVEPEDKLVHFDHDTGAWIVTGDYEENDNAGSTRTLILAQLHAAASTGMKPDDIASKTGLAGATVRQMLRRMAKAGQIQRTQYGTYASL